MNEPGGKHELRDRVGARQVGSLVGAVLDPVLEKRAGISTSLIDAWEEIAGEELGEATRPVKIQWPRRASDDDPFEPATLTLAADPSVAFVVQHETESLIAAINAFLGFVAIGRIRIMQKPVRVHRAEVIRQAELSGEEAKAMRAKLTPIEDDGLRQALERLAANMRQARNRR
jgi:hypothetical protein